MRRSRSVRVALRSSCVAMTLLAFAAGCGSRAGEKSTSGTAHGSSDDSRTAAVDSGTDAVEVAQVGSKKTSAPKSQSGSSGAAKASSADWPQFRGPTGMGASAAEGLPTTWSQGENIAWKTPLPGAGASSPIVFGDRIYLTAYTGFFVPGEGGGNPSELKRHLIAIDRKTGTIAWDVPVPAKLPEERSIRDHGFAANTPAADADHVYVFYGKTGVFAFDHAGKQVWDADVGNGTNGWGTSASPVLHRDLVFVNASVESGALVALDRKTGRERWRKGGIRESWNSPVLVKSSSGRDELIVAKQGKVLAFDPQTGDELWNCNTDIGWYMVPSVVAADGVVYCLGGRSGTAGLAVRTGGSGDVTRTHRLWTSQKGSNVSSPVVSGGHLYWVHEQRGIAFCAQGETGETTYEQPLERGGQFYASALLGDGKVYYLSRDGKTFVVRAQPKFELLATNDLRDKGVFNASPAVDGARLLIRSDKFLYCVGK